jgi:transposase-like protein
MAASILKSEHFQNEEAAFAYVESRLWPDGPVCPHCGSISHKHYDLRKTRIGLRKCSEKGCRKQFTVRIKTIFEDSHLPLHLWLQIIHLMCASKKGVSTNQVQRLLKCSMKTAWFLTHRIREALRSGALAPMGGNGGIVEVDETFIGRRDGFEAKPGWVRHKNTVLTLVERGGAARSFHIDEATKEEIVPIVRANLDRESHLMTDEARRCEAIGKDFSAHGVVDHSRKEYGYTDHQSGAKINTNTVEGYYSIFKRGMKGVYQHCSEQHLHRYLADLIFDIRTGSNWALTIPLALNEHCRASRASD